MREQSSEVVAAVEELDRMRHQANVLAKLGVVAGILGAAACLTDLVLRAFSIRIVMLGLLGSILVFGLAIPLAFAAWWVLREYDRASEASYARAAQAEFTGMAGAGIARRIAEGEHEK
jgi:small neutral amino acid transporter SnatA (MarC family)